MGGRRAGKKMGTPKKDLNHQVYRKGPKWVRAHARRGGLTWSGRGEREENYQETGQTKKTGGKMQKKRNK